MPGSSAPSASMRPSRLRLWSVAPISHRLIGAPWAAHLPGAAPPWRGEPDLYRLLDRRRRYLVDRSIALSTRTSPRSPGQTAGPVRCGCDWVRVSVGTRLQEEVDPMPPRGVKKG